MSKIRISFAVIIVALVYVPLLPILDEVETFVHPWRLEIITGILLPVLAIFAFLHNRFSKINFDLPETIFVRILFLFICFSLISCFWSDSPSSALHHSGVWAVYLLFFLLARSILAKTGDLDTLHIALICISLIITIPPLVEALFGMVSDQSFEIVGRYGKYGEMLVTFIPLLFVLTIKSAGKKAVISGIALTLSYILLFTLARRAPLGLAIIEFIILTGLTTIFPVFKDLRKRAISLAALVILGVFAFQLVSFSLVKDIPVLARNNSPLTAGADNIRQILRLTGLEMFRSSPIIGIGADNFGYEFQTYKAKIAERYPDDIRMSVGEDMLAQRAHNEYLQVAAELGSLGALIFILIFLFGLATVLLRSYRGESTPIIAAAVMIGTVSFLISSGFTSFSFRLIQNGIVFFLVLASGMARNASVDEEIKIKTKPPKYIAIILITSCIASFAMAGASARSVYAILISQADLSDEETAAAEKGIERAIAIDPDNPNLPNNLALLQLAKKDYQSSANNFKRAIDHGRINSTTYSNLATAAYLCGDTGEAIKSISDGLDLYPTSIFLLTRRAALLQEAGNNQDAEKDLAKARSISPKDAEVWYDLITRGAVFATKQSFEKGLPPLMELSPRNGVYAIANERQIRFPEEAIKIPGMNDTH